MDVDAPEPNAVADSVISIAGPAECNGILIRTTAQDEINFNYRR
jgi:hypothetical protein